MSIAVTPSYQRFRQDQEGNYIRRAKLVVTGLTSGAANTIPHGLPSSPIRTIYVPRVAAGGFETQDADDTNLYWTAGTSQTSIVAYVDY